MRKTRKLQNIYLREYTTSEGCFCQRTKATHGHPVTTTTVGLGFLCDSASHGKEKFVFRAESIVLLPTSPSDIIRTPEFIGVVSSRGKLEADQRASSDGLEDGSVDEKRPAHRSRRHGYSFTRGGCRPNNGHTKGYSVR